jgi:hypothetical protein
LKNVSIVFLTRTEILPKIINHTNKETDLKAPHPVIYGGVLDTLSQIFGDSQWAKMTVFLPVSVSKCEWIVNCFFVGVIYDFSQYFCKG